MLGDQVHPGGIPARIRRELSPRLRACCEWVRRRRESGERPRWHPATHGYQSGDVSNSLHHEFAEPLRRVVRYRTAITKHRRVEGEVSEPRDARRLSLAVFGDHLRAAADPSRASAPNCVAREQHAAGPVQEERSMAGGVTRGVEGGESRDRYRAVRRQCLVHRNRLWSWHNGPNDAQKTAPMTKFGA